MIAYLIVMLLAVIGLMISFYIFVKKKNMKSFVCPLRAKCENVIHSEYSKFLGIPVERIGLAYYASLAIGYGIITAYPVYGAGWLGYLLLFMTISAALFSVYLTFIQVFTLRQLCSWCLMSAVLCVAIATLVVRESSTVIIPYLEAQRSFIVITHLLGMALGLGAATMADIFFFRFLKDYRISEHEAETLNITSQIIWFSLAIAVASGIALFLPNADRLLESSKFLVKMIVAAVIIVNGGFLNLVVAPHLVNITFHRKHKHYVGELHRIRRIAFALGPISIVSWYTAFILGALRSVPLSFSVLLGIYLGIVAVAITIGQICERILVRRASSAPLE